MPYATASEVRGVLAPGGADPSTATTLDDAGLNQAIAEATAEVDARLRGAPFPDPAPDVVRTVTRDIAAYLATLVHRRGVPLNIDDPIRLRFQWARDLLAALAAGKAELPSAPGEGPVASVVNLYEGTLFTPTDLGLRSVGDEGPLRR